MPAPERWLVLTARIDDPARRDLLIDGLLAIGGQSILEEGDALTTYLRDPGQDIESFVTEVGHQLADAVGSEQPPELAYRWQDNEDWELSWRRGLQPRKVSRRLVVKPSWTGWETSPGEIVIEIDPQMAFGTGEHATTRGCLRLLDTHLRTGSRVLDVGSGSGILAIAAARLGASEVLAVEYDPDANINARENIERNDVGGIIELRETMADDALLGEAGDFDLIVANILSGVIRPLLPAFARALKDDGQLIVSGILQSESEEVVQNATAAGFALVEEDREEDWWSAAFAAPGSSTS
jgi:ribosomal protein L11 methyltransferase